MINTSDTVTKDVPKIDASVVFEDIGLELEEIQYRTILNLVEAISCYEKVKRVRRFSDVKFLT